MSSAFLLDLAQCIGCEGCVVACNTGNDVPDGAQYIAISEQVRGTFPDLAGGVANHRCYHCADAACVSVCPTGALYRDDGLTRVDVSACSGCAYCVGSCPYDVPVMVDGVATKCDGCRDVVSAGGVPWCVETCPSDALRFGPREEIAAEAHARAAAHRGEKYPDAQVYGERQAGGLGVLVVAPEDPETLGLPADPKIPLPTTAWQEVVKPGGFYITSASVLIAGLAGVIARRNHAREMAQLEADHAANAAPTDDNGEVTS